MGFGKRLKTIRKDMKLTQKEMAESFGIGYSTLQKYEASDMFPGSAFLIQLANKYGYNLNWLLAGTESKSLDYAIWDDTFIDDPNEDIESEMAPVPVIKCYWKKRLIKEVPLIPGGVYEVKPINPSRTKFLGEKVILIDWDTYDKLFCLQINSNSDQKSRNYTEFDACDLILLEANPEVGDVTED